MSRLSCNSPDTPTYGEDIQLLARQASTSEGEDHGESDNDIYLDGISFHGQQDTEHQQRPPSSVNIFGLLRRARAAMSRSPLLRSTRSQDLPSYTIPSLSGDGRLTSKARDRGKGRRVEGSQETRSSAERRGSFLQSTSASSVEIPAGHGGNLFEDIGSTTNDDETEQDAVVDLDAEGTEWSDKNPPDNSPLVLRFLGCGTLFFRFAARFELGFFCMLVYLQ